MFDTRVSKKNIIVSRLSRVSVIRSRRVQIWAGLVFSIVLMLVMQMLAPDWRLLPRFMDCLAPGVVLVLFLAALLCEYIDSSLGMGYGTTLTPLLLLAGFEPLQIVPCVLLSEFLTGITAVLMHQRDGNVDLLRDGRARKTMMLLSVLSAVGAITAVTLVLHVPTFWLKAIIAIIILSVGITILVTIRRQLQYRRGHIIAVGAIAAFNKGLSGGGYGPLVTAGQVVSGIPPKHAVAITSLAESLTCIIGFTAYILIHRHVDLMLAGPLTLGALLSVPMATLTVKWLPENAVRSSVGVMTCLLGILTLIKLAL